MEKNDAEQEAKDNQQEAKDSQIKRVDEQLNCGENNEKVVEKNKVGFLDPTGHHNEHDGDQQQLILPPRRRLGRMGSMRKISKEEQPRNDHKEICASLRISDNKNSNDERDRSVDVIKGNESKLIEDDNEVVTRSEAQKSVPLKATLSEDLLCNESKKQHEQSCSVWSSVKKSDPSTYTQQQLMERMRRWKTRWITSEQAKIARKQRLNRIKYYLKLFLAHLFSTAGLCFLVTMYSCLGAFTFQYLELQHEKDEREKVANLTATFRNDTASQLWDLTLRLNVLHPDNWTKEAIKQLKEFEKVIVYNVTLEGYYGSTAQWTFSGALLYSVTVITTIGIVHVPILYIHF